MQKGKLKELQRHNAGNRQKYKVGMVRQIKRENERERERESEKERTLVMLIEEQTIKDGTSVMSHRVFS